MFTLSSKRLKCLYEAVYYLVFVKQTLPVHVRVFQFAAQAEAQFRFRLTHYRQQKIKYGLISLR